MKLKILNWKYNFYRFFWLKGNLIAKKAGKQMILINLKRAKIQDGD